MASQLHYASSRVHVSSTRVRVVAHAAHSSRSSSSKNMRVRGPFREDMPVEYGPDWYEATRQAWQNNDPAEEAKWRRLVNFKVNHGVERKDLYTENFDGDTWNHQGDGSPADTLRMLGTISAVLIVASVVIGFNARIEPRMTNRYPDAIEQVYGTGAVVAPFEA